MIVNFFIYVKAFLILRLDINESRNSKTSSLSFSFSLSISCMRLRVFVFSSVSVLPTSQSKDTSRILAMLAAASIEGFISSRSYLPITGPLVFSSADVGVRRRGYSEKRSVSPLPPPGLLTNGKHVVEPGKLYYSMILFRKFR